MGSTVKIYLHARLLIIETHMLPLIQGVDQHIAQHQCGPGSVRHISGGSTHSR